MNSKTIISALFTAAALVSCEKKDQWVPTSGEKVDLSVSIVSSAPTTKTALESTDSYTYAFWTSSDILNVMFDNWEDGATPLLSLQNTSTSGTGEFKGMARGVPDGSHYLYAFATNSGFEAKSPRKVLFNVPEIQAVGHGTFDPHADIVASRRYQILVKADNNHVTINDMPFYRLLSTITVSVGNKTSDDFSGEKIKTITLESKAQGIALTGSILYDFDSESASTVSAIPKVTANLTSPLAIGNGDKVFILIAPVTLPKGSILIATFETEHYSICKTITLPQDMPFSPDKLSTLTLNIDSDTVIDTIVP